ncbi:endonuclease Q family protein [Bacillus kwashiorkori]|uniref:endonuclease Q family protein n=1 Tax=Bacillus kwashiorkori TaxID=1522318 RepID=UPI0007850347|nr:endonuclease Q family protein [Bacillus kwashiorkori]
MKRFFADLHIHIGRTKTNKAVKITGSRNLTLTNILDIAKNRKGLQIVGVIDCHSPEVIEEIEDLLNEGRLETLQDGGLLFEGETTLLMGSELEIYDLSCQGPLHVLCFLPTLETMKSFSEWLATQLKNIHLSSQRIYATGRELQRQVKVRDGLFIPAHVFTPFKSLYGKGVKRTLREVFDPKWIDAIELGLSSDTFMADELEELHHYPFVTNSDAHSLGKIAREYQKLSLNHASFNELKLALEKKHDRKITANFGLDPLLGKYHQTTCAKCFTLRTSDVTKCPNCGSSKVTKGVFERIRELANATEKPKRPPYIHQVPLEFIPGLGPKTMDKLLANFGTEMTIIHDTSFEDLTKIIPEKTSAFIIKARTGGLKLEAGGGGKYGRVKK